MLGEEGGVSRLTSMDGMKSSSLSLVGISSPTALQGGRRREGEEGERERAGGREEGEGERRGGEYFKQVWQYILTI